MAVKYDEEDKPEVQMTSMMDCIFLLLIFFLVSSPEELSESLGLSEERTREDARYVFLKNRTQVLLGTL